MNRKNDRDPGDSHKLSLEDTGKARLRIVKGHSDAGIDPYDGALPEKRPGGKKDLKKLGEWLEAKRTAEERAREEADISANAHSPKGQGKKD